MKEMTEKYSWEINNERNDNNYTLYNKVRVIEMEMF